MKNFRNFRRNKQRNNVRSFKSNASTKFNGEFNISGEFKRKKISRNVNASKLIEKYTELAKEALSNGDKILSENYLQHADHFTRVLNERESIRRERFSDNKSEENVNNSEENNTQNQEISKSNLVNVSKKDNEEEKASESLI